MGCNVTKYELTLLWTTSASLQVAVGEELKLSGCSFKDSPPTLPDRLLRYAKIRGGFGVGHSQQGALKEVLFSR